MLKETVQEQSSLKSTALNQEETAIKTVIKTAARIQTEKAAADKYVKSAHMDRL